MKKFFLSLALIAIFAFYVLANNFGESGNVKIAPVAATSPGPSSPVVSSAPAPQSSSPSTQQSQSAGNSNQMGMGSAMGSMGMYKNGTYIGSVADAYYGNVQVQVTVQSGKVSDVKFLQHPGGRSYSIFVNSQAMPYLIQEAVQAQNSNVDIVSGATETSLAFQQSLASALAQAKS